MKKQIYFIDTKLNNYQTIINSLSSTDIYYLIDSTKDGLTQISNTLLNYSNLDSIHIYSHGSIGSLNIGNMIYDNTNISDYKIELENIGKSLSSTGDILLYGCNVGKNEIGLSFINQIAKFTQADVASSNNLTGNKVLAGDWDLEVRSGVIESEAKEILDYESLLNTIIATPLTNGQIVSFDNSSDNYYSFKLNDLGNVLISGTDSLGENINTLNIYDSNFNKVDYVYGLNGSSLVTKLTAGTYYINAIDSNGGKFYLTSSKISGGTIASTPLTNGKIVSFDNTSWDNYYSFKLNDLGNVLISGTDSLGENINTLNIYDSNFNKVDYVYGLNGSSLVTKLTAGTYYINAIDSNGGKFYLTSSKISGGTIASTPLTNGQIVSFDNTSWDNYYSFKLNDLGNVLISGTDSLGENINTLNIYDSNFNKVDYVYGLNGSSLVTKLTAGTYYINAIDSNGGKFYLTSSKISGGTIASTPLTNGQIVSFDNTSWDNYYSFKLNDLGNVLISGTDSLGENINTLNIYDSNFNKVDYVYGLNGSSLVTKLTAGTYYINAIDSNGGKFYLTSSKISGGTIPSTPLTNGQILNFDNTSWDNYYSFKLNDLGNVLISGTDSLGESINYLSIYDSNFNRVETVNYLNGSSLVTKLTAGTYYINAIDSNGGKFYINTNETPRITSGSVGSVVENSSLSTVIYKATATDTDVNITLKYSISGIDSSLLNINSLTGAVTLKTSANYESKKSYSFNVIVSDGSLSSTKGVILNVINVAEVINSSVSYTLSEPDYILTLTGTAAINGTGNTLNNKITGNSAANKLTGGAGNDILDGKAGIDTMIGGTGNDTYYVDNVKDVVTELASQGTDTVNSSVTYTLGANVENLTLTGTAAINGTGNTLNNVISGNTGNNVLNGGAGNDTLKGGLGNDTLYGGAGIDTMIGGTGNDTYYVDNTKDVVTELASQGTDTVNSSITYTLTSNVENLTLTGTAAINGTGNTLNNVISGNTGNNVLNGGAGNDILDGKAGIDTMIGGTGNDTYYVDNTKDVVTELASQGTDTVNSSITYTLTSNVENLTLTGTAAINGTGNTLNNVISGNTGNNVLNGGAGNDILDGKAGIDTMIGGTGNDTYYVDNTKDVVTELASQGTDTVNSSITYTLTSNVENLTLTGTAAINGTGNTLNNVISGNTGNNVLNGGAGNDTLKGGLGNDILYGGTGKDTFVFNTKLNASTNKDTIKDFNVADDTISLENAIFTKLTATGILNKDFFKVTTDGKAKDSNDYIVYNKTNGQLFYDADGNGSGASVLFAVVENKANLTNADFTVI